ncbi:hypothetical protein AAE478_009327 [Parahypoxylon ruwenzoriense]
MNFVIEVPGAATPLNPQELYRNLEAASSHDNSSRQSATQQLGAWESDQAYYPTLQSVFLDKSLPKNIRLLAIIQLKNGIDKYWRRHVSKNAIPPASKQAIRERLFQGTIGEEDEQLAMHNALVIAKVVRIDYPTDWSEPLATLIGFLRATKDGNQFELSGVLKVLLRVIKELGSARLRKSQAALQSITPEIVYLLGEVYDAKVTQWTAFLISGKGDGNAALLTMKNSHEAFKALRRLLLLGYDHPHKDKTVAQVWSLCQAHFAQFLGFIDSNSPNMAPYIDIISKHLIKFTKLHVEMAKQYPASFASLPNSLDLVRAYWDLVSKFARVYSNSGGIRQESSAGQFNSLIEGPLIQKLALKGLLLIRACIKMVHYPTKTILYRSKESVQEQREAINAVGVSLLTDDFITEMANVVISHFFVFRRADLEAWDEDPQEWEQRQENQGNAHEFEVRPCAERLFLDLLTHHTDLLREPLLEYFATAQDQHADFLKKEAVYTAMGLAAGLIEFDFADLLKTTVSADAQRTGPLCQILRRRIAILLSQWVLAMNAVDASRSLVYEIFRHFLNPNDQCNDIVVRITAARQFKIVINEEWPVKDLLAPFARDILAELISLLQGVDIDETKLAILATIKIFVERMDYDVNVMSDTLMDVLPGIWQSAGDLNIMTKQSVLAIIQELVASMRAESLQYQPKILPLIVEAMQENTEVYLYLLEEALDLWKNVLMYSPPPLSPDMLRLAPAAIKGLESQNEHADTYLDIVFTYILLAPEALLENRLGGPALSAIGSCIGLPNLRVANLATMYIGVFAQVSREVCGIPGLQAVVRDMMEIGLLTKMFKDIHDHHKAGAAGQKEEQAAASNLTLPRYFVILSYITVADPATFVELLGSFGPLDQVWDWLSAEWFLATREMSDEDDSKLSLIALTRFIEIPIMQDLALLKIREYFQLWLDILREKLSVEKVTHGQDLLVKEAPEGDEFDSQRYSRQMALKYSSPPKKIQSLPYVKERLHILVQRAGGEQSFQDNWVPKLGKLWLQFQNLGAYYRTWPPGIWEDDPGA